MNNRKTLLYAVIAALVVLAGLTPLAAQASTVTPNDAGRVGQEGGEPTPAADPARAAFDVARDALEEAKGLDLSLVTAWAYEEAEWLGGIDDCRVVLDGEEPRQIYFGWRFVIQPLFSQARYEVRTSFNRELVAVCDEVTVDLLAGQTGGGGGAAAPAPVTGSAVAGSFELGGQVVGLYPGTREALNAAKMKWVKMQLRVGENGSGLIAEAHGSGFKILLSVLGDKGQVMNPAYHDVYANYVAGLASSGADAIEVWNEANIDREWPAGQINGANYVPLLAKAYNAIKTANPNTIVITGAPAPTGFFAGGCADGGCNDDVFISQMVAAGAGNYADCIGIHYNEGIVPPTQSSGDPRGSYPTYFFSTMLSRGLAGFNKPACITEIGYLSPEGYGPLPAGFAWAANTSVQEQATWLAQAAVQAANSGRVRLMIVFNVDFTHYGADPQAGYAIIRADGSCPACAALAAVQ